MTGLLVVVLLAGPLLWLILSACGRDRRLRQLEISQARLLERLSDLERAKGHGSSSSSSSSPAIPPQAPPEPRALPRPARNKPRQAAASSWRRLERLLIRNGTAILGVVIVVAGITFLALHLAQRFGPFARFVMVLLAAAGLAVPSWLTGRRSPWRRLALRLRSGSGALLLLACAAAGTLPALGLQWLQDPLPALALLMAGMLVNLWMAATAPGQGLASLHVAMNLVPLLVVEQGATTLTIAAGVTLAGTLLRARRPWPRHRLVVNGSFLLFEMVWLLRMDTVLDAGSGGAPAPRLLAITVALVVFGTALLLLHLGRSTGTRLTVTSVALLLISWGGLTLPLLLLPASPLVRSGAMLLLAAASLGLGRLGSARDRDGLRLGDELVAQALLMAAIAALAPLVTNPPVLLLALQVESALFLLIGIRRGDLPIRRAGWALVNLLQLALLLAGLQGEIGPATVIPLLLAGGVSASLGALLGRKETSLEALPGPQLIGWGATALAWGGAVATAPEPWRGALALVAFAPLLAMARRWWVPGLSGGLAVAVSLTHLVIWGDLMLGSPWTAGPLLGRLLPLITLTAWMWRVEGPGRLRRLGLDLSGATLSFGAFWWLAPMSALLPALAWLLLSAASLGLVHRLPRRDGEHVLALGLGNLTLFVLAWMVSLRHDPTLLMPGASALPARVALECLAVVVVLGWWLSRPHPSRQGRLWRAIHPWFLEATLLGLMVTLLNELPGPWRPAIWAAMALILLLVMTPRQPEPVPPRLAIYAVVLHWLGSAGLLFLLSRAPAVSSPWLQQPEQVGLVTLALQSGFLALGQRRLHPLLERGGSGQGPAGRIARRLARHPQRWAGYPFFAALAGYLALRYDRELLTLFWTLEALAIYGLGGLQRDRQFRRLALLGLGACLVRLVTIDMAQADLGLRGAVFIGVGASMLAMNALASRFQDRFD